jgi:hypothetical protein
VIGYRFVEDHRADDEVSDLCGVGGVSRSGYYAWRSRPLSDAFLDDAWLANEIFDIWVASRRTYGRPGCSAMETTWATLKRQIVHIWGPVGRRPLETPLAGGAV